SRSHGNTEKIPLAGVPFHSADKYLARLLSAGEKVVVVEQVEDPKTAKGIVKREIVEIYTPGTATVDGVDDGKSTTWLAAVFENKRGHMGLAALDLSTGVFMVDEGMTENMVERLKVLEPSEILYSQEYDRQELAEKLGGLYGSAQLTGFEEWNFDSRAAERDLNEHFGTSTLDGFGVADCQLAIAAAGAIFRYLRENQRDRISHINRLTRFDDEHFMQLDYSTVRNLELLRNNLSSGEENSLFAVVNLCHTAAGSRRLSNSLLHPFKSKEKIDSRQSGVAELVRDRNLAFNLRTETKKLPDLEKLAGRLGIGRLNPRQAAAVKDALRVARQMATHLKEAGSPHLVRIEQTLPDCDDLVRTLEAALVDEPPLTSNKGNIFKKGHSQKLDDLNASIHDARKYIGSLQNSEREKTGISSLKVGFNKVFGYYIEVTKANTKLVPNDYIRKQTLVNAERYVTPELKEKEELILSAEEKIFKLETELYEELLTRLAGRIADIIITAELVAEVDLVAALAELAVDKGYCRPEIFEDTRLSITNGRHPVIEAVLPPGSFVANDVSFDSERDRFHILTGPNMSGKSTYLRQVGLIVILAQIGSFVPADSARIGLVDRVFTRVGAIDNLARGQSTFLVEMVETANILHNATERSLLLLDEVGRGTSTFDGLSIAWAVVEYINEKTSARTIFATHYHELTGMAEQYEKIKNYQVAVKRWEDRVIFLHKIIAGGCDDSYGIEVARLAGLPRQTLTRARQILRLLESGKFNQSELSQGIYREKVQASLFEPQPSETEEIIRKLNLDTMSPVQAFELLRRLKEKLE
ncbi:MAG: DNA mismatch repair protein MutS, partial [candidate division Zixibacteria bacterium]|nr:DNA mismatch repair protein MutS [candidate division Zixibacteria bacterium]